MIEISGIPKLLRPVMVTAFEGWNDAADSATDAIEALEWSWDAKPLGDLDPEDYYDFQVNRPTVSLVDGVSRRVSWPTTRLSLPPPVADVATSSGCAASSRTCAGGRFAVRSSTSPSVSDVEWSSTSVRCCPTPRTRRPIPVTGTAVDGETARRLGLEQSRYEGPTGIVGVFNDACVQAGLPAVSLWAAVPHYVAQPPLPQGDPGVAAQP